MRSIALRRCGCGEEVRYRTSGTTWPRLESTSPETPFYSYRKLCRMHRTEHCLGYLHHRTEAARYAELAGTCQPPLLWLLEEPLPIRFFTCTDTISRFKPGLLR